MLAALPQSSQGPILLVVGLAVFAGTVGARVFQKLRVPQVVGYILIGVLIGRSGLRLIGETAIQSLDPFNYFALGLIGFMIGGELRLEGFRKSGRQYLTILLVQGIGAFVVVGLLVALVGLLVLGDAARAAALGLIFGAISSATAPAATVNVLWEYKARGPVTRAVYAIIALDDGLALVLFALAFSVACRLIGAGGGTWEMLRVVAQELAGAVALGALAGVLLNGILRRVRAPELALTVTIGVLVLVLGAALTLAFDLILASMTLGVVLVNLAPRRSLEAFAGVGRFAAPIYVLFFVAVGAHLSLQDMQPWMWWLAIPYALGRVAAKVWGANLGARLAGAGRNVRRYLGMCLFCQGGVAIGLSLLARGTLAGEEFGDTGAQIGTAVIMIVTATTLLVELVGPLAVKLAIQRAGEAGLDVTEDDLVRSYTVGEQMDRTSPRFHEGSTVAEILRTVAETDASCYPVTDGGDRLRGVVTLEALKASFAGGEGMAQWLVASDVMQPAPDTIGQDEPLSEALTRMQELKLEYLPVVGGPGGDRLVGMLELRAVSRSVSQELLRRRHLADEELS